MASEQPSPAVPLTYSVADHAREIRTRVAGIGERTEFEHGSGRERIVRRDYASDSPTVTTPVAITHRNNKDRHDSSAVAKAASVDASPVE